MKNELATKIEKIARLAFDPAAAEGESVSALTMIARITRKNGIDFDGFRNLLGVNAPTSRLQRTASTIVMPFGKYTGRTLEEIYQADPDYLEWVSRAVTSRKELRKQVLDFLHTKRNKN